MKKKQKWLLPSIGLCLFFLLVIPLYAIFENKKTKYFSDINCPKESGSLLMYLPHPTDCSKYIMCILGLPTEMECPYGLYYDPSFEMCDYPENVNCDEL